MIAISSSEWDKGGPARRQLSAQTDVLGSTGRGASIGGDFTESPGGTLRLRVSRLQLHEVTVGTHPIHLAEDAVNANCLLRNRKERTTMVPLGGVSEENWMLRRVLLIAMLLLSALLVGIPSGQAGASSTYSTFTGAAGTCIDNLSSATANNNVVGLYTCNNTGAQAWTVDAADSQPGTIVNSNGFCLRVAGGGITPGTAVVISGCEGQPSEEWTYGHDSIVNVDSGLCVQDWTNRTEDDDPLVLNTCNGSQTQQWIENARPDNNIDLSTFFPIGVETQTNDDSVTTCDFECWKNRGINTLVNVPVGADEADWDFSARLDGLKEIRPPSSNIIADASDPALIGWAQPDEPDVEKNSACGYSKQL